MIVCYNSLHPTEEQRWLSREEALRREAAEAREAAAGVAGAAAAGESAGAEAPAALLQQLAALQRAALERERAHAAAAAALSAQREISIDVIITGCVAAAEAALAQAREHAQAQAGERAAAAHAQEERARRLERELARLGALLQEKTLELDRLREESEREISELRARVSETDAQLAAERAALDAERRRNVILQVSARGDVSPAPSASSDTFAASFWHSEEPPGAGGAGGAGVLGVEEQLAALTRREGSRRGRDAALTALAAERRALAGRLAAAHLRLQEYQNVQEQYDALLQMYGEKEEQLEELRLDLHDVTQLYKAQLADLIHLRQAQQPR
ncbi:unnamed protein product, partial [Brenthis ino]